jgi:hypothetical protein
MYVPAGICLGANSNRIGFHRGYSFGISSGVQMVGGSKPPSRHSVRQTARSALGFATGSGSCVTASVSALCGLLENHFHGVDGRPAPESLNSHDRLDHQPDSEHEEHESDHEQ